MNTNDNTVEMQNGNENPNIKKQKTKLWLIIAAGVLLVGIVMGVIFIPNTVKGQKYQKQFELGKEYLEEMDYESAIAAFEEAIAIDPKCEDAYIGLADAYEKWAESEIKKEEYEVALACYESEKEILLQGKENIGSEVIGKRLEQLDEKLQALHAKKEKSEGVSQEIEATEEDSEDAIVGEEGGEEVTSLVRELEIDFSLYDSYSTAIGNVIIVEKDGLRGAIDYDGNVIVPLEYNSERHWWSATDKGYFVLSDEENFYLFDAKGNIIYSGTDYVYADEFCYEVVSYDGDIWDGYESYSEFFGTLVINYYDYQGTLLYTSRNEYVDYSGYYTPAGTTEQKVLVTESVNITDQCDLAAIEKRIRQENNYADDYYIKDITEYLTRVGFLTSDGKIEWIKKLEEQTEWYSVGSGASSTGIGHYNNPVLPFSNVSDGYFMLHKRGEFDQINNTWALYDVQGNMVFDGAEIWGYPTGCFIKDNKITTVDLIELDYETAGIDGWEAYSLCGYFRNGHYFYNYGTKIIVASEDNDHYALIDLANGKANCLGEYEYLSFSESGNWLTKVDGRWGYTDTDGKVIKIYDDACDFNSKGYAVVVENNQAYLIDESLNVVEELGEATGCSGGEALVIKNGDDTRMILVE